VHLVAVIIRIYHDASRQIIYRRFSTSKIERCSQVDSLYSEGRNSSLSPNTKCCEIATIFFGLARDIPE